MLLFICGIFYGQSVIAQDVSNIFIDQANGHVSWMADGMQWYTSVELDPYFGNTIPIISIDIETGNEVLLEEITNDCYYRGTLATPDPDWEPVAQTHAFINLCHSDLPFTGFISDVNGVYTIEEDPNAPGHLIMQIDDPTTPLTTPNETNSGNNGGYGKLLEPDVQVARNSTPDKFPSVEIFVEPSFIETFGTPGYIHRIVSTIAFSNFIYGQSGMKQTHLISIDILNGTLNHNGGIGAIKHQLQNLRRSMAQSGSGDVSVLMVGGDIDSTYTWGWGIDANACELQIAVAENDNLNTKEVGKSAAFVTDLPSLIQRGWIFAHEFGHVIGASKHVNGDPLMDGWFQNIDTLSGYIAGCDAKTQIFKSCSYDPKKKNVTDFYTCE
jgi:hypothetical protein